MRQKYKVAVAMLLLARLQMAERSSSEQRYLDDA
jgi:hypothetical protein